MKKDNVSKKDETMIFCYISDINVIRKQDLRDGKCK
jgi:hypothetical protein